MPSSNESEFRDFTVPPIEKPWAEYRKAEITARRLTVIQEIATLGAKLHSVHTELGLYNAQLQDGYRVSPTSQPEPIQPFLPGFEPIKLPVAGPHEKPIHFTKPYSV